MSYDMLLLVGEDMMTPLGMSPRRVAKYSSE